MNKNIQNVIDKYFDRQPNKHITKELADNRPSKHIGLYKKDIFDHIGEKMYFIFIKDKVIHNNDIAFKMQGVIESDFDQLLIDYNFVEFKDIFPVFELKT